MPPLFQTWQVPPLTLAPSDTLNATAEDVNVLVRAHSVVLDRKRSRCCCWALTNGARLKVLEQNFSAPIP
jgi:hypothetical protein